MNERQKEQQHVNETIALIHREQAILCAAKTRVKMLKLKEIADKRKFAGRQ